MKRLLLLLVPVLAGADVRLDAHVGGGIEGGTIQGVVHPDGIGEIGAGATWFGDIWGVGVVVDRIARRNAEVAIASEHRFDVVAAVRGGRHVGGIGAGIRKLEVAAGTHGRASTLWGLDLLRIQGAMRIVRVGPVNLDFYYAWTFGLYKGEVYGTRSGDMAFPVRDILTVANSYTFGLQTSFDTHP